MIVHLKTIIVLVHKIIIVNGIGTLTTIVEDVSKKKNVQKLKHKVSVNILTVAGIIMKEGVMIHHHGDKYIKNL